MDTEEDSEHEDPHSLPIREDIEWSRLKLTFDGAVSKAPSAHRYFTFLYYLFPCNTIRFLRYPVRYLNDSNLESFYAVSWEDALDEAKIRSSSEVSSFTPCYISSTNDFHAGSDYCACTFCIHPLSGAKLRRSSNNRAFGQNMTYLGSLAGQPCSIFATRPLD